MFSFEICKIFKKTFLQRTPLVAVCYVNMRISSLLIFENEVWLKNLNNLQNFIPKNQTKQNHLKFTEYDKKESFLLTLYRRRYDVATEAPFYRHLQDVINQTFQDVVC